MSAKEKFPQAVMLGHGVEFAPPLYLAPMEGVTDRTFRGMILEQNGAATVGAACTEFQRVSQVPLSLEVLQHELGPQVLGIPVGIQLMGNEPAVVGETACIAAAAGAAFVDLNFGCPAPRVFQHCAGSALLNDPMRLEAMVCATVRASPIPVTVKIRAGVDHATHLEEIAQRVEQAGAKLLTVHARLRSDHYHNPPDWSYIARVKAVVQIPVLGNGNADSPDSIEAMVEKTGCDGVMIGRGAMRDPLLFRRWHAQRCGYSIPPWTLPQLHQWLEEYHRRMLAGGTQTRHALGRVKQAIKALGEGGLLPTPAIHSALRLSSMEQLLLELC